MERRGYGLVGWAKAGRGLVHPHRDGAECLRSALSQGTLAAFASRPHPNSSGREVEAVLRF